MTGIHSPTRPRRKSVPQRHDKFRQASQRLGTRVSMRYEYDVLVVGAGPVGLTTAILLGARGWRVGVVERWPRRYALPRAVTFDHDTARVLASLGLADVLPSAVSPGSSWRPLWRSRRPVSPAWTSCTAGKPSTWPRTRQVSA
ncbi:hypothetical protein GTY44_20680 [Streptomyces sp. SID5914]|nr:hypothetical protein [Streptomyces sp. SID5914]